MSFKSINEAFDKKYKMGLKESVSDVMEDVEFFLRDYFYGEMSNAESELCQMVASEIPTYNPDWCSESAGDVSEEKLDELIHRIVQHEMKVLFANAPMTEAKAAHPDLSDKETSISNLLLKNKDRIDNSASKEDLVAVLEDILADSGLNKAKEVLTKAHQAKNHMQLLQYIYNFILSGDNLASIERKAVQKRQYK